MTKIELFLKLAKPDEKGYSRWVNTTEFIGDYADLKLGNGGSWCRKESILAKIDGGTSPIVPEVRDSACLGYYGLSVDGVKVEDSPKWMQQKLLLRIM